MRSSILHLATVAGLVSGFKFPAGLGDGTYAVSYDAKGNEAHTLLNSTLSSPAQIEAGKIQAINHLAKQDEAMIAGRGGKVRRGMQEKRGALSTYCGCGIYMDHGNCDAAVEDLKQQLDRGSGDDKGGYIEANQAWYSIRGNAVAFICEDWRAQNWRRDDVTNDLAEVTRECGWYVAGTLDGFFADVGYMIYTPGLDFCGHATGSPVQKC
ncbi:hypothetical protein K461DRAFT_323510 [Myriangium duriaei CBS 260.36]|uniref:Uncharacterized protein n=1 Tax=Myriangium duriaei CBS 260.36 TaxID=1168546 RepID=A0A9P4J086_9PEZI|nr:hypothetical protein K461DRAFT_323510 [Myriangium duriaei CBS 260.36]